MIYNFFCFKCGINLIDNCRIICRKTKMCHFNITFLHKFLYRITITSMESFFYKKNDEKILLSSNFSQTEEKLLTLKAKNHTEFY